MSTVFRRCPVLPPDRALMNTIMGVLGQWSSLTWASSARAGGVLSVVPRRKRTGMLHSAQNGLVS